MVDEMGLTAVSGWQTRNLSTQHCGYFVDPCEPRFHPERLTVNFLISVYRYVKYALP